MNCLKLIKTFISRFDGDHILEEDQGVYDQKEMKHINVNLHPDKVTVALKLHPNQTLWQLKRKAASYFRLKLSEFHIKTKQGPLDEAGYNEQIKEYSLTSVSMQRVPMEEMEKEFPKYLIGHNQDYLNLFLDLMAGSSEVCSREVLSLLEILPYNNAVKNFLRDGIKKFSGDLKLN